GRPIRFAADSRQKVSYARTPAWRLVVLSAVMLTAAVSGSSLQVSAQDVADTRLDIEVRRSPSLPVEHYILTCDPRDGTVRDPESACQRIADLVAKATGSPTHGMFLGGAANDGTTVCAQVYGGPEVAVIRGRFLGAPIDARLTRGNGCTMSTFDATMRLLGVP